MQAGEIKLEIKGRQETGKNAAHRARQADLIPAVVYGPALKTGHAVNIARASFREVYAKAGRTTLVTLESTDGAPDSLNGSKVFVKDIQVHPFKNKIQHVDLHQLDLTRSMRVTVPLKYTGRAKGLNEGGILSIATRDIEVKALPTDVPHFIEIDVSDMDVGDSYHVTELEKKLEGQKYELMFESDYSLVAVVEAEEEKAAVGAAVATPEGGEAAAATPAGGDGAAAKTEGAAETKKDDKK